MTAVTLLEIALALLVLIGASYAVFTREHYAAVIAFAACGLLVSLVWVLLRAVDVAMTEAAIGSGLTGVLLLGAAARMREQAAAPPTAEPGLALRLGAAVAALGVGGALAAAVFALPEAPRSLAPQAVAALPPTGLGNAVTAVLMVFRATDTLLEKVVLVLALVGVWSFGPDIAWGGRPGQRHRADPAGVLAFVARRLPPIGVVVGIYLLWVGADHPGGAFPGATVLAAMWLLTMLAGLTEAPPIALPRLRAVLALGAAMFFGVGLLGLAFGAGFLTYPAGYAKAVIVAIEVAMTLTVAVTLTLLMAGAPEQQRAS